MRPCQSVKSENLSESPGRGLFIGLAVYRSTFARTAKAAPFVLRLTFCLSRFSGSDRAASAISSLM